MIEFPSKERGEGRGASAFDDSLFKFHQAKDGKRDVFFTHADNFINAVFGDSKGVSANLRHSKAIGERGPSVALDGLSSFERSDVARAMHRFYTDDLDVGLGFLDGQRYAGDQAAPTDGADNGFEIGDLLDEFEADSALAGDDFQTIKAVDVGLTLFFDDGFGVYFGFADVVAGEHDACAHLGTAGLLDERGITGHDDCDWNVQACAVEGQSEGVVACGSCDDTFCSLCII